MKLALAFVVVLGCASNPEPAGEPSATATASVVPISTTTAAPGEVTFVKHAPAVGDRETTSNRRLVKLKGEVVSEGKTMLVDSLEESTTEKIEECLAVAGNRCRKVKVTYTNKDRSETRKGKTTAAPTTVHGKTYVVEVDGADVRVQRDDGQAPRPEEVAEVKKDYKTFGSRTRFVDALPDGPIRAGDSLEGIARLLGEVQSEDRRPKRLDVKVVVEGFREEAGKRLVRLDVHYAITADIPDTGEMKLELSGKFDVRVDGGFPVASEMSGPMSIEFGGKATGNAKGLLSEKQSATYSW